MDATGAVEIRPALAEEIRDLLGADPGSLGAVGVKGPTVIADLALGGRKSLVTGANEDDWHYSGVDVARDIGVGVWADLRSVGDAEPCSVCGSPLDRWKGIEVGHIFKLGTKYSEAFGATVQDESGASWPIIMGSYGIGVERAMAAVVESSHDDGGIIWPVSVAPYEVVITVVRPDDGPTMDAASRVYQELGEAGIEVLLDDREERPGVKFADSELIGIPYRVTLGPRGVSEGVVELTTRRGMSKIDVPLVDVVSTVRGTVETERFGTQPTPL
jgi:prolyl-tRNA synthetase